MTPRWRGGWADEFTWSGLTQYVYRLTPSS